jgi:hypothetical protein
MTTVTVQAPEYASATHRSEIDYAVSMHFSAAYLPSGSSPSLGVDLEPSTAPSPFDSITIKTKRFQRESTKRVTTA